jgi:Phage integrase family
VQPAWTGTALAADCNRRFEAIDLHFHDLRHEAALRWLERGYKLNTIATLLGHSDLNTLRVYLGIAEEDALAEAERLSAALPPAALVTLRGHDGERVTVRPAANRQQTREIGRLLAHATKGGSRRQAMGE